MTVAIYCCTAVAVLLGVNVGYTQGEAFSATANLIQLLESERELIPSLEAYIEEEEQRISAARRFIDDIVTGDHRQIYDGLYAGHPVNAYNLLKRWQNLASSKLLTTSQFDKFSGLNLPTEDDLVGASTAMLRLQRTFSLRTEDIAQGLILNESALKPLAEDDLVLIGSIALRNSDYGLATEWLEKALDSDRDRILPYIQVYKDLYQAYKGMNNIKKAVKYAGIAHELDKNDRELKQEYNQLRLKLLTSEKQSSNTNAWQRLTPSWRINYERLCREDDGAKLNPKHTKNLLCRYKTGKIPWIVYKEEIFSWNPRISMFYDVISDNEAEMVKSKAHPLLRRAKVYNPLKGGSVISERVSKVAWLWDTDPEIEALSQRVEDITGLQTKYRDQLSSSEPFQVVNYGIGGQYEPHLDFRENKEQLKYVGDFIKNTGDRLSTFLLYLSDVKYGGATVFPRLNIHLPPIKNGAAFWYNAKLSGEFDINTEHAGCPVLLGEKWISNKWIREYGQEFRRPCALDPHTIDRS